MAETVRSPKSLGAALRRHRRQLKLTQTELAARAGIRQGTVSQVENGLETIKLQTLMHLLRALDLEMAIQPRSRGSHSEIEDLF